MYFQLIERALDLRNQCEIIFKELYSFLRYELNLTLVPWCRWDKNMTAQWMKYNSYCPICCDVKYESLWHQYVRFCGELEVTLFCSCLVMLDSDISHGDSRCVGHRRIKMWHKSHFFPRCGICDYLWRHSEKQTEMDVERYDIRLSC